MFPKKSVPFLGEIYNFKIFKRYRLNETFHFKPQNTNFEGETTKIN